MCAEWAKRNAHADLYLGQKKTRESQSHIQKEARQSLEAVLQWSTDTYLSMGKQQGPVPGLDFSPAQPLVQPVELAGPRSYKRGQMIE